MNFTFRNARLLAPVAALCLVALLTLSVNAEIIERAYNSTEEAVVGANDILIIKGTGNDNTFSYNNYSGAGDVYFNPGGYSYFTTAIPDGYTNTKVFIAGNALGLQSSKTSSDVYGSERILVLTNELPTTTGTTTVNEGTLFNANGSSPTYDNDIQIKGVGGLRVGWNLTLTVSGKISDYTDANGNVTPGKLIIEKDGTDICITNWNNDYSGGTQIGGGNVTSGSNSTTLTIQPKPETSTGTTPLGTGPIYFGSDNSQLDMAGNTISISAIDNQKESGGNYSGNSVVNNDNPMPSPTFNAAEGANFVYTGSLPTISGTLTKTGAGSQTIVTADVENVNVTEGTMGFSGALVADSVTIADGATLKMTGTGSSFTVANPVNIQNGATLFFENAVPRNAAEATLSVNIAEGGTLKFYETNSDNHNVNNSLVTPIGKDSNNNDIISGGIAITGDGKFVKTGTGKLFITNQSYSSKASIVLSDKAVIDVQEGDLANGGWNPDCWKKTVDGVTTYNQATLNIGPKGTVDLWDGTLYVGGITGGSIEGDNHGLIKSTNKGHIVVGMGMTDADKTFVYNGNVDLAADRSITKEGATTQVFTGTYRNLGTTTVNGGVLELAGTSTLGATTVNNGTFKISGTAEISNSSFTLNNGTLELAAASTSETGEVIPGGTLKISGTNSSLTSANQVNIPNGATLYFDNATPRNSANTPLAINIEKGGTLEFHETDTGEGHANTTLVTSNKISITGSGKFIKSGAGDLFVSSGSEVWKGLSIVLNSDATIDVQEGCLANGNYYPDCWKATSTVDGATVTTYNQATLNINPKGTVDLWDGTLYVGGITGGSKEGDLHGEINSPKYNSTLVVGMGINEEKSYTYSGNVDLESGRTFTKEGATTQIFDGNYKNLGTTNVNGGTLEFSGNATLGTINFANDGNIKVTQNGVATLTKEMTFTPTTPINVDNTATLILDPGDEKDNVQNYTEAFTIGGSVIVKSGYLRTTNVSSATTLVLDGGILKNNGEAADSNNVSTINSNITLLSNSSLMAGWNNGKMFVNGVVFGDAKLIIRNDMGNVYLNNANNSYTGGTQVGDNFNNGYSGSLVAGAANVLGTGRLYFGKAGASFDMAGYAQTIGGLGKDMSADEVQYKGAVNNSGAETTLTINVPEGETYNYNGSVANNISIVKTGKGTQQFNLVQGATFSDSIVVNAGRLDMKEYYTGLLTVKSGGVFSPGNSIGTLNLTGDFNLDGGTLLMEIDSTGSDQLIIDGRLNLNDGNIVLQFLDGMSPNEEFAVVLDAANSPELDEVDVLSLIDSYYFSGLSYTEIGGYWTLSGKVDANAVPEPSTWALLALGVFSLLYLRKRRI